VIVYTFQTNSTQLFADKKYIFPSGLQSRKKIIWPLQNFWLGPFHNFKLLNTLAAILRIYHAWNLGKNQEYFGWLTNRLAPQPIVLENCSNPQKTKKLWSSIDDKRIMASLVLDGYRLSQMGMNSCFSDRKNIQFSACRGIRHLSLELVSGSYSTSQFFCGLTIECG